jgi:hypothetical protein
VGVALPGYRPLPDGRVSLAARPPVQVQPQRPYLPLRPACTMALMDGFPMLAPETFSHIENIQKRAGHLWRFL